MARLITEERRVLTGSLHTVPDIYQLFNLHKCDWMARDPRTYNEEIVREFYASYAATLYGSISKQSKPIAQDPLTSTMVRDGESAEWVATPRLGIRKATLNFVAKFFWLLVHNRVSPTKANNQLTWDIAFMVAALVAGLELDFAHMLLAEIHERTIKTSTTYPFPCLIFQLCRDSGVPIWHYLAHTVGQAQDVDPIIRDHTDTILASFSQATSRAPSSSRSTPPLGVIVVPLARVQKLEAQMATLLHHIQSWMQ
ncbi:hypothetical protein H5410_030733, partial [Solanum commersonii]